MGVTEWWSGGSCGNAMTGKRKKSGKVLMEFSQFPSINGRYGLVWVVGGWMDGSDDDYTCGLCYMLYYVLVRKEGRINGWILGF